MATFREELAIPPSVAGIVVTTMVLKDEFLNNLTLESFTDAMAPKIKGNKVICFIVSNLCHRQNCNHLF